MIFYIIPQEVRFFKEVQKMKLYKVTTVDQYHDKRVFTVAAKSQYEALTKASVISPHENVLTIEEVR